MNTPYASCFSPLQHFIFPLILRVCCRGLFEALPSNTVAEPGGGQVSGSLLSQQTFYRWLGLSPGLPRGIVAGPSGSRDGDGQPVKLRLPMAGEGGWVCCGEPWLSRAVVRGVVIYLVGVRLPVAGVVAWFAG